MRVLLFDMHVDGHHLEVASGALRAMESVADDVSVDFLGAAETERHRTRFNAESTDFLFENTAVIDRLSSDTAPAETRARVIRALREYVDERRAEYDALHLLQVDDILREAVRGFTDRPDDYPALFGTIAGAFFNNYHGVTQRVKAGIATSVGRTGLGAVPDGVLEWAFDDSRRMIARNVWLVEALDRSLFDHLFVTSEGAANYVRDLSPSTEVTLSVVPEPVTTPGPSRSKPEARQRLGLPANDDVLLFFGEMRREKGIEFLLRTLREYDGPPFTLALAGKPTDVSVSDVEAAATATSARVHSQTEFISEEEMTDYFAATDCVVFPYLRYFGDERTSSVFQKACAHGRPVIAPAFGTFERWVSEFDLGLTFEPESGDALRAAIREWLTGTDRIFDPDRMDAYASSQGFDALAERYLEAYRTGTRRPTRAGQ